MEQRIRNPIHRVIGENLRNARLARYIGQTEMADQLGMQQPNLARIEAGRRGTSLTVLAEWCLLLGVEPGTILPTLQYLQFLRIEGIQAAKSVIEVES